MSTTPIFVATHPRACSTAFERVFMTRRDILHCVHEPFGDAFYFGPERLGERYEKDEKARQNSGFANTTYKDVMDSLLNPAESKGKRLFIKDIAHYLLPPNRQPASIAPSLRDADTDGTAAARKPNGATTNGNTTDGTTSHVPNPTVIPLPLLRKFHFTFLIRHPRRAIPSYYRCTIPPLSAKTGFHHFMPSEAGYDELRRLFDYLVAEGVVFHPSPSSDQQENQTNGSSSTPPNGTDSAPSKGFKVTVIDADDLLDKPAEVIRAFCADVGIDYHDGMLRWGDEEGQRLAVEAFEKWNGFHDDAIGSTGLRARVPGAKKTPTEAEEDEEWRTKYGEEGQRTIRACVEANVADYEYLKSFAVKV